ncbi:MAG: ABC transporter substrate-binding protein [Eubacteriales bacterium]|nr:ABC transporter substrate-binding protein [Eubacteriales bacterium]
MKKLIAMLLALVMVLGLAACGGSSAPAATQAPAAADAAPAATEAAAPAAEGRVYYLNFKPEADGTMQELAKLYTETTGIPVKVVTAASGTYSDTLTAEMAKSEAPTIYNIGNMSGLADWDEYALDLTGTAVAGELTTNDFNLYNDAGELKAIGHCFESYGIIVNKALLEQAGHSIDEITDFASLKAVADDIHARSAELGFDAFSAPGLDGSSSWRFSGHLVSVPLAFEFAEDGITEQPAEIKGTYMDNFRSIWDLYITDTAADAKALMSSTGDESEAQFGKGEAVFYQNGTWEYSNLVEREDLGFMMNPDDLAMIPIYTGISGEENYGLSSGTENCWAVNSKVSEADQKASLDFLYWLVTDEVAAQKMVDTLGALPFKSAPASSNVFLADGNALLAEGKSNVSWAFNHTPNVDSWRATVVTALAAYSAAPSDAAWADVVSAVVDGWAYEYSVVNG